MDAVLTVLLGVVGGLRDWMEVHTATGADDLTTERTAGFMVLAFAGLFTCCTARSDTINAFVELIEDIVAKKSGPVDEAIPGFVRDHVPSAMHGFFALVMISGSAKFLLPLAGASGSASTEPGCAHRRQSYQIPG